MKKLLPFVISVMISFLLLKSHAVRAQVPDSTQGKILDSYPKFQFKGLFQGRFTTSLKKNVDVEGLHHIDDKGTNNSFSLKYMRAQVKGQISKRVEVVALANFADFKNDPKTRVLENAYLRYSFNPKVAITVGQFRPWFGLEETYPVDIIKSLEWSNQYTEFGKNGWTSFQIGASVGGTLPVGKIPMRYAISVVNGNGKNQVSDKDNGKQFLTRIVFDLSKRYDFSIGLNGGTGTVFKRNVHALAFDISSKFQLAQKWNMDFQIEAKQAINHNLYFSLEETNRLENIYQYQMRGAYFLPNMRYEIDYKNLKAIEFSCRYEYLDTDFRQNSNPRQSIVPMFSLEFLKNYGARIQMGMQIDYYKHQIESSNKYNGNLFILQVQSRL
ncbi:OprO/OprP family phosphate-selective porin [Sphingobacterium sp. PCS056]|uniref:porin n=1 Tax=Sphingobacterium TaxID=28453 RepID=UPI00200DDD1B|nr:porin [Sphingobacterium sp. PCS056]UPZ36049.1 OprO/OprP family phosphate-selective porin [Sphingobacterium sp. PCS056]